MKNLINFLENKENTKEFKTDFLEHILKALSFPFHELLFSSLNSLIKPSFSMKTFMDIFP